VQDEEVYELSFVVVVHETEKALLIESSDLDGQEWVPKSQITDASDVHEEGDEGSLVVTMWIAKQKGWI